MTDKKSAWQSRHAEWLSFVLDHARLLESGKRIPPGPLAERLEAPVIASPERPLRVALCSPHPDDEALTGALPLRLRLECGARVTNLAITLGSDTSRRPRRLRELESACCALGFELVIPQEPRGFDDVSLATRSERRGDWAEKVAALSQSFERLQADVVFAPHAEDWHPTHVGTHFLAVDALGEFLSRIRAKPVLLIETAYWHEHAQPNLMVGVSPEAVATLVMATAEHGGEVQRNAYHLRLPSRLIENVRRGAETVGGAGVAAPDFPFAELYRVTFANANGQIAPRPGGRIIGPAEKIDFEALIRAYRRDGP